MKRQFFVRAVLAAATLFLLSGCAEQQYLAHKDDIISLPAADLARAPQRIANTSIDRRIQYAPYNKIVIQGPATVVISARQPQSLVTYVLPANHLSAISVRSSRGTLYITSTYPGKVTIQTTNDINALTDYGSGNITASNIGYSGLSLKLIGNINMTLNGNIRLKNLVMMHNSVLHTYWVNGQKLNVTLGDNAKAFLAGVTDKLNATVNDNAMLDTKYLRTQNAFVRANDSANAAITVLDSMNVWASGASTVYYYNDPKFQAIYLDDSGTVLRMVGLPDLKN